jgi:hypothetical protein
VIISLSGEVRGSGALRATNLESRALPEKPENFSATLEEHKVFLRSALIPMLRFYRRKLGKSVSLSSLAFTYAKVFLGANPIPITEDLLSSPCDCFVCNAFKKDDRLTFEQEQRLSDETLALIYWLRERDNRALWGSIRGAREAMQFLILSDLLFGAWLLFELECIASPNQELSKQAEEDRLRFCRDLLSSGVFLGACERECPN